MLLAWVSAPAWERGASRTEDVIGLALTPRDPAGCSNRGGRTGPVDGSVDNDRVKRRAPGIWRDDEVLWSDRHLYCGLGRERTVYDFADVWGVADSTYHQT